MMPKFPKTLYVTQEGGDEPYWSAQEGEPAPDETDDCAVYQLVTVGKIEVSRRFVAKPKRK